MRVSEITKLSEISHCVDLYLSQNDESFMSTSREVCIKNLNTKVRMKKFVRVIRDDSSEIIAWIYADKIALEHTDYLTIQQMYYGSSQHGSKAVRCIKLLHEAMLDYATRMGAKYCTSAGSPYDEANVFAKILEKSGWTRRGYLAVKKLKET